MTQAAAYAASAMPVAPVRRESKVDAHTWSVVQQFMRRTCGVVLRDDQVYLLESRLTSASKLHGFASIAEYVNSTCYGLATTAPAKSLIDAMTTHETMFYRDGPFWTAFESTVIPKLIAAARDGQCPRIWSAACSTGQEPYSIAMLLDEHASDVAARIDIIATDVAELSVTRARAGLFTPLEVNRNVNPMRLMKHFVQAPGGFRVRDQLRERISFQVHNLLGANPDPANCDVVLCRNALIYFGDTDRAAVLKRLQSATKSGGYVALGSTETWREGRGIAPGWYQVT